MCCFVVFVIMGFDYYRGTVLESLERATLSKNTTDALPSALGREELGTSGEPEGFLRTLGLYPPCPFYRWITGGSGSSRAQGQIHPAIPFPDLDLSPPQRATARLKASALRSSLPPEQRPPRAPPAGPTRSLRVGGRSRGRVSQGRLFSVVFPFSLPSLVPPPRF